MKKYYKNEKGQVAGWTENGIYRKRVKGSKHQLRKPPAYGIDENIFQQLVEDKVTDIRIQDTETMKVYAAPPEVWADRGFLQDRGHGLQHFLLLEDLT